MPKAPKSIYHYYIGDTLIFASLGPSSDTPAHYTRVEIEHYKTASEAQAAYQALRAMQPGVVVPDA